MSAYPSRRVFCDIPFPLGYIAPTFSLLRPSPKIRINPNFPIIAVLTSLLHSVRGGNCSPFIAKYGPETSACMSHSTTTSLHLFPFVKLFFLFFISVWVTTARIAVKGTFFWYNQDRMSDPGRAKGGIRTVGRVRPGEYVRHYAWLCDAALH